MALDQQREGEYGNRREVLQPEAETGYPRMIIQSLSLIQRLSETLKS
jgi:hypothetical protein